MLRDVTQVSVSEIRVIQLICFFESYLQDDTKYILDLFTMHPMDGKSSVAYIGCMVASSKLNLVYKDLSLDVIIQRFHSLIGKINRHRDISLTDMHFSIRLDHAYTKNNAFSHATRQCLETRKSREGKENITRKRQKHH